MKTWTTQKKVCLGLLLGAAVAAALVMPRMVESTIPAAYYITPNLTTYENVIHCTGTVQSESVRQVVLSSPIVPQEVFAAVGDQVEEGDLLAKVDLEKTGNLGLSFGLLGDLSGEMAGSGGESLDLAALASSYGRSLAGGGKMDAATLEELLSAGEMAAPSSAAAVLADWENGEIPAPITGVVIAADLYKEVPAAAGKAVFTIADNQNYKVLISIREEDVGRVQVGDGAKIRGVGFPGAVYEGVISKIYPTARKALTSTETVVDAEVTVKNPDKRLKLGFSAKVEILGGNDYNLLTVPYEAVKQDEHNNEYVYLYDKGKLKKQRVVTGKELTSEVEILEGVSYNSVVVHNPSDAIKEGAMIHLKGRAPID